MFITFTMIVERANLEKIKLQNLNTTLKYKFGKRKKKKTITAWMQVWIRGFNYLPAISGFVGICDVEVAVPTNASAEGERGRGGCGLRKYMVVEGML